MVHDVRAPPQLHDRVILDRLAQVAPRLERDACCVAGRAEASAGAHRDGVAGVVDLGDVLGGRLERKVCVLSTESIRQLALNRNRHTGEGRCKRGDASRFVRASNAMTETPKLRPTRDDNAPPV